MISMETLPYFGLRLTLGTSTISASELFIFEVIVSISFAIYISATLLTNPRFYVI